MNCKNCQTSLIEKQSYCDECGAKVVKKRITVKGLLIELKDNVFGWDNKYFFTIRMLLTKPHVLIEEYISGTRKKYLHPFTFIGIGSALAIFLFNVFTEDYLAITNVQGDAQTETMSEFMQEYLGDKFDPEAFKKDQIEVRDKSGRFMLKYFNQFILLILPLYSFISFLVYRKPYNYGEHLVINTYLQGISFLSLSILFLISLYSKASVFYINVLLIMAYYTYVYGRLYKLSILKSVFKFFKFLGITTLFIVLIMSLSIISGFLFALLMAR